MSSHCSNPLLIELLTEELPPKALAKLAMALADGVAKALIQHGLADASSSVTPYATPRRLAVVIERVYTVAADVVKREKLLPVAVGRTAEGQASPALLKKLAAMGFADKTLSDLEIEAEGKQPSFYLTYTQKGARLVDVLEGIVTQAASKLPIPKVMTYQIHAGTTAEQNVQFVRPVKSLLVLHGDTVVPMRALGVMAGRVTSGHRFMGAKSIEITQAQDYADTLRTVGKVEPDFAVRRSSIVTQLRQKAGAYSVIMPDDLLDEVTALTECPVVYAAEFDAQFLAVPQECLILTMQTNQKYFALTDAKGQLVNQFLVVSNLLTDSPEAIIEGNARVVRPRLADAQFFFEQDKKRRLDELTAKLSQVVYHNKLGSQGERVQRLAAVAGYLAEKLQVNTQDAIRAAHIMKADLVSDMVGEFPELQGIMGQYYARHHGEKPDVAAACAEHYQPRFAGDELPQTSLGMITALADKLETLIGIWGIGLVPTGDKDPFALRRHALGVVRIMIERQLPLALPEVLNAVEAQFAKVPAFKPCATDVLGFVSDRLRGWLKEQGFAMAHIEAVLAGEWRPLNDIQPRLQAVQAFAQMPEAADLAAANKRCVNITRKAIEKGEPLAAAIQADLLVLPQEQALAQAMNDVAPRVSAAMQSHNYTDALTALAQLRAPVDAFFADVMVMADDAAVRAHRLRLLSDLAQMMNAVADISELAV